MEALGTVYEIDCRLTHVKFLRPRMLTLHLYIIIVINPASQLHFLTERTLNRLGRSWYIVCIKIGRRPYCPFAILSSVNYNRLEMKII